jgi:hypothetical protein
MARHATVDATEVPVLRRIAEGIRDTAETVLVRLDGQNVAVITPVISGDPGSVGVLTQEQFDRLLSAAGGWQGIVDAADLKEELRRARGQAPRQWEP